VETGYRETDMLGQLRFLLGRNESTDQHFCSALTFLDFHLLPKLKIILGGRRFSEDDELKTVENAYFGDLAKSLYRVETSLDQVR
jgi:hypothetical protein